VILLDTNVLLWLAEDNPRLGAKARERMADPAPGEIWVCAISFWEIGLLLSKKRVSLATSLGDFVKSIEGEDRFRIVPVDAAIAMEAGSLPRDIHGDPGDRFLIAAARLRACPLLTSDGKILSYAERGHVQAIDARL